MAEQMNCMERALAAVKNEPVDRLPVAPLACGVNRRLSGTNYIKYSTSGEGYADAWIAGWEFFGYDAIVGLGDLSIISGDMGAEIFYPEENTPMFKGSPIKEPDDYRRLKVPKINKGTRMYDLVEGVRLTKERVGDEVLVLPLVEGPLLALTQLAGTERVLMDMYRCPDALHEALQTMVEVDKVFIQALVEAGAHGIVMDYLWGNYSCLGDEQYMEFEGATYAPEVNAFLAEIGTAFVIHNCADLPHLDTQIKDFKPLVYSYCYYPDIPGSMSAKEVIKEYGEYTVMLGNLDPQMFVRANPEQMRQATEELLRESVEGLEEAGLKSRFCIASGCEVPPALSTKMTNIKIMCDTVREIGPQLQQRLN
ncbi:MAG: uroporphyrinogen decarboxylase family protein [Anaerolineae bacterium]